MTREEWIAVRTAHNHDWLKNRYLRQCRAFLARVEPSTELNSRAQEFLEQDWPEWVLRKSSLDALLASAEDSLSPRRLISALERSSGVDIRWLEPIVHHLWLERTGVSALVRGAEARLAAAHATFSRANDAFVAGRPVEAVQLVRVFVEQAVEMSAVISRLPSGRGVV